jgi:hypothetical protein
VTGGSTTCVCKGNGASVTMMTDMSIEAFTLLFTPK